MSDIKIELEAHAERCRQATREGRGRPRWEGESLANAPLSGAVLDGANFRGVDFEDADLADAILMDADLTGADLTDANLTGADLTGANLTGAYRWLSNDPIPGWEVVQVADYAWGRLRRVETDTQAGGDTPGPLTFRRDHRVAEHQHGATVVVAGHHVDTDEPLLRIDGLVTPAGLHGLLLALAKRHGWGERQMEQAGRDAETSWTLNV